MLQQFPFVIRGFHSDNRSEFINTPWPPRAVQSLPQFAPAWGGAVHRHQTRQVRSQALGKWRTVARN